MNPYIMPGFFYLIGALLIPFFTEQIKKIYLLGIPAVALVYIWLLPNPAQPLKLVTLNFLTFETVLFQVDRLSWVCAFIFAFIGLIGTVYCLGIKEDAHFISSFIYIGASLGAVFAGDFLTMYIFWEIMALAPTFLVWINNRDESIQAGSRYLIMHTIGGLTLFAGIMLNYAATGSMAIGQIQTASPGFWLILAGIGLNAAFFPFHTWLPDTYPQGSYATSIVLSVYTTKTAVYMLARTFAGAAPVAYIGGFMALYGVSYALLQNNPRKLLSYHIISQVGYMVAAIGVGSALGIDGAIAHLVNNILYKTLLFMCVGSIVYMTGRESLTDMGGLARKMPFTFITCLIAALSIGGVPGFTGFISKSLVLSAAHENEAVLILLEIAAVGTFLSFCKLIYYAFLALPAKDFEAQDPPLHMKLAMVTIASLCIFYGINPSALTNMLPIHITYRFYGFGSHTFGTLFLLGTTYATFNLARRVYSPHKVLVYDLDWFYKRISRAFVWLCVNPVADLGAAVDKAVTWLMVTLWQPASEPQAVINTLNRKIFGPLTLRTPWQDRAAADYVQFCGESKTLDSEVVDGVVNGVAEAIYTLGSESRGMQTGLLYQYAQSIAVGLTMLLLLSFYFF